MDYYTITDKGRERQNNEDSYYNNSNEDFSLHIVADGMGGALSGEVASQMACEYISNYIEKNYKNYEVFELLLNAVDYAHKIIYKMSTENDNYYGMGTTLVIALIIENVMYFGNIGDSRIYKYNNDKLDQLTKDHSYVQELLDAGAITKEEAFYHSKRNQITSALGTDLPYKFDLDRITLNPGDCIIMATDGLVDLVEDDDIKDVLNIRTGSRETCEILNYIANSTGGYDNITITCINVN